MRSQTPFTEYKFLLRDTLGTMWGITSGFYTAGLIFIEQNVIRDTLLFVCVFFTWFVLGFVKNKTTNMQLTVFRWDSEREG